MTLKYRPEKIYHLLNAASFPADKIKRGLYEYFGYSDKEEIIMKKFNSPSRLRLAMLSLIITALFVNVYELVEKFIYPEKTVQAISGYLDRFVTLRDVLPLHGAVGYIDGLDDGKLSTPGKKYPLDEEIPTTRIYLAQYALSPVILVRSLDYPLVVGNFVGSTTDIEMYRKMGLVPLRDLGKGIIMFKREFR